MNIVPVVAAVLLMGFASVAGAQGWREMYDLATLEQWHVRYERTTRRILDEWIVPVLSAEERRRLGAGLRVEFPLYSAQAHPTPLDFYAPHTHVAMPIFSLKFLDDLCTAYAWLQINDYSLETVSEYTAPLLARSSPISPPLKALQIPANALNDPRVNDLALMHFTTARTFILLHELGHLYHRHTGSSIANEKAADHFAARVMRLTNLKPLGMLVFFLADAHWSYPSTRATHPLSGARVSALADHLDDPALAKALRDFGTCSGDHNDTCLDDPDIRAGFAATAKAKDEASLAPRRLRELPMLGNRGAEAQLGTLSAFHGLYKGESGQLGDRKYPIAVTFQRRGNTVTGDYSFGIGVGKIKGEVAGDTLYFEWTWAGNTGHGMFATQDNGASFTGKWGYGNSWDNAGEWGGRRVK